MNNQITKFEGQDIKVRTDKGIMFINLANTAKICGLTRNQNGYTKIRWTNRGVTEKLRLIAKSTDVDKKYLAEINYILNEIENTDDRNLIYMSTWLTKRLALECHSQTAMRYKNFLVTLDETGKREDMNNGVLMVGQIVNQIIPTLTEQLALQVVPVITEAKNQVNNMVKLMHDQAEIYDQDRRDIMTLIGMKSAHTKKLTDKLKSQINKIYGFTPMADHHVYIKAKNKVFNQFDVIKWEDIAAAKYNEVYAYIDGLEKSDLGIY